MSPTSDRMQHSQTSLAILRLLLLSWLIVAFCFAFVAWKMDESHPGKITRTHVNPNVAPWWELTVLPEIGPARARQIVDFREMSRERNGATREYIVFRSANDLDAVHGIGPRTIERLIPHLRFETEKGLPDPPGATDYHGQSEKKQD